VVGRGHERYDDGSAVSAAAPVPPVLACGGRWRHRSAVHGYVSAVHAIGVPLHRRQAFSCRRRRRQHSRSSSRAIAHSRPANCDPCTGTCADRRLAPPSGQSLTAQPDHYFLRPWTDGGHRGPCTWCSYFTGCSQHSTAHPGCTSQSQRLDNEALSKLRTISYFCRPQCTVSRHSPRQCVQKCRVH
jgi:hypothetical protein